MNDFSQLPPEVLMQIMQMGELDEEQSSLEHQMAQAEALAQGSGRQYSTPGGNVLGGLANVFDSLTGHSQQSKLRGQQEGLRKKKTAGRQGFLGGLIGMGGRGDNGGVAGTNRQEGGISPASLMTYGGGPQELGPVAPEQPFAFGYRPGRY